MGTVADRQGYVLGLDAVRFWAACSVAWFHLAFWSWASPPDLPFRASGGQVHLETLAPFAWWGWSGVETFFVLSGFVICASAERSTAYAFLRGRIARLYPAVWICAPITAVVSLAVGLAPADDLRDAYLRTLAIWPTGPWIDSVYRTLIVEGVFYALVLGLLLVRGFRRVELVALLLAAYSIVFWLVGSRVDVHGAAPVAILNFSKYGIFFALGMMVWVAKSRGPTLARCALIATLSAICAGEIYLVALGMAPYVATPPAGVAVGVWAASLGVLFLSVACDGFVSHRLGAAAPLLRTLGLMTYPLYLLHDVVGATVLRAAHWIGSGAALALAFAVSLGLAWLVVQAEPHLRRPLVACLDTLASRLRLRRDGTNLRPARL